MVDTRLSGLFEKITNLEKTYMSEQMPFPELLPTLESALNIASLAYVQGIATPEMHTRLIKNALLIAYEAGKQEARLSDKMKF